MRSHSVLVLNSAVWSRKLVKGDVTRETLKYLEQTKVTNHLEPQIASLFPKAGHYLSNAVGREWKCTL